MISLWIERGNKILKSQLGNFTIDLLIIRTNINFLFWNED